LNPRKLAKVLIKYELLQNQYDPTDFTFVEEWASNEALNSHLDSPHFQAAAAKLEGLVTAAPDIRRYHLLA
jgi:quinol monooxygenase YgiN